MNSKANDHEEGPASAASSSDEQQQERRSKEEEEEEEEECWDLPSDFGLYAKREIRTVRYCRGPPKRRRHRNHRSSSSSPSSLSGDSSSLLVPISSVHRRRQRHSSSFRLECIEPDTPLDINIDINNDGNNDDDGRGKRSSCDATGQCVWAGAALLIRCIDELMAKYDVTRGNNRRVIEFGCGTGVGGLAVMMMPPSDENESESESEDDGVSYSSSVVPTSSHVCFTDNDPDALDLCRRNCMLNGLRDDSYSIAELSWGVEGDDYDNDDDRGTATAATTAAGTFDVGLATDVLYDVDMIGPLFKTASGCIMSDGIFILSHIPRACYNEGNPPDAREDLEKYIIDRAARYNMQLEEIIRPPEDEYYKEIFDWCKETSFEGGGILVFRRS